MKWKDQSFLSGQSWHLLFKANKPYSSSLPFSIPPNPTFPLSPLPDPIPFSPNEGALRCWIAIQLVFGFDFHDFRTNIVLFDSMVDSCNPSMAVASPPRAGGGGEKKHWWFTNKKMVEKYVREARRLISTQDHNDVVAALALLDTAIAAAPRMEAALEMKSRCLLNLRRFREVADMLQDYIPSLKMAVFDDSASSGSSDNSSNQLSREQVKLLSSRGADDEAAPPFKCFSVSDLKRKVMAGLGKTVEEEGQWRYLVLGQACFHLGLLEDAMMLLQTGKRLATAAFRRESISLSDDIFCLNKFPISGDGLINNQPQSPPKTELDSISHLLSHIKLLIRRKTAALAALDAGLYAEAIRHFSKILDGRRGAPQGFLPECYVHRASAYQNAGRIAEAIADCNRALAFDTSCIEALGIRASLFETIRCLPDSLHDLEHLKLLYNSILRDRKLGGPIWKRQSVQYREIPGKLCSLATKIQQLKQRVAARETGNVDYYALMGLRRGCSRSELERAHLLLTLKHKPDKSSAFIEKCEFFDEKDMESVRDRARMSALLLYRLIQKGHTSVMSAILEEKAAAEEQRKKAADLQAAIQQVHEPIPAAAAAAAPAPPRIEKKPITTPPASVFQGVFCRDLAVVGNLLSQTGFNRPIPVKYEAALTC